jgi:hypothetical protein
MRKATLITGIVAVFFGLIAMLFRLQQWPGGGISGIFGVFIFCFLFQPFFLVHVIQNSGKKFAVAGRVSGMLAFMALAFALLFSIQNWPGPTFIFIIAAIFGIAALAAFYLYLRSAKETFLLNRTFTLLSVLFLFLQTLTFFISDNNRAGINTRIADYQLRETSRKNLTATILKMGFSDTAAAADFNSITQLSAAADNYLADLNCLILTQVMYLPPQGCDTLSPQFYEEWNESDRVTYLLVGETPEMPQGKATELLLKLQEFKKESEFAGLTAAIDVPETGNKPAGIEWIRNHFYHKTMVEDITYISELRISIQEHRIAVQQKLGAKP